MGRRDNGSVTIHRTGFYSVDYQLTPLAEVAGQTKTMPDEFIAANGTASPTRSACTCGRCWAPACRRRYRLRLNPVEKVLMPDR